MNSGYWFPRMQIMTGALPNLGSLHRGLSPGGQTAGTAEPITAGATGRMDTGIAPAIIGGANKGTGAAGLTGRAGGLAAAAAIGSAPGAWAMYPLACMQRSRFWLTATPCAIAPIIPTAAFAARSLLTWPVEIVPASKLGTTPSA